MLSRVADASARTYTDADEPATLPDIRQAEDYYGVVVPSLRRFEYVRMDLHLEPEDLMQLRRLRKGFEVWALVPLELVGRAHAVLRGRVDQLQPWWVEGDAVRFGAPRVP